MAAVAGRRADDAILETMTQQLLQISSVFLVQQSELQQVRDRLKKELVRVNTISEALTSAAQQHQDAVLTVIQNYESVAAESAGDALGPVAATSAAAVAAGTAASYPECGHRAPPPPPPPMQMSAPGAPPPHLDQALARQQSVRQVHLPPVASQPSVFTQLPAPPDEDEDEGIRYVDNLKVVGGLLGTPLKASGDFVGTPQATWFRQRGSLSGRSEARLEYLPTADDVGAVLRLECVGPYGGKPVAVETSPIALDPPTHAELEAFLRKGQAEFHAFTPQQEARIVLVTRKNIKVRSKSSRMGGGASTLYKQGYQRPVTAVVDEHSPQEMALQLGALKFELLMETPRMRDLAVLCIRMFAGPNCPTHEQLGAELDLAESEDTSARSQPDGSERPTEASSSARGAAPPAGAGGAELGGVHWSDDEEEGEGEEEFKPAMEVKIRAIEDVVVADTTTLKKFSLGLAPPKAAGGAPRPDPC